MAKKNCFSTVVQPLEGPIDCACVIHGDGYSWNYVEKLYSMLNRHISVGVRFHVYTEHHRPVPAPWIKHPLIDWGISGPKKSWWYKMQLFNPEFHRGPLLYFDLDTVITKNIDWIWQLPLKYFWTVRDFKHLWRPTAYNINSSVMWWNTAQYEYVWSGFKTQEIADMLKRYHGDQDYITDAITEVDRRFFDVDRVNSWRWQALDGGYDFRSRKYKTPGAGTVDTEKNSVLVFHGNPKPDKIQDPIIVYHWQ
jgi:hypothetical protein